MSRFRARQWRQSAVETPATAAVDVTVSAAEERWARAAEALVQCTGHRCSFLEAAPWSHVIHGALCPCWGGAAGKFVYHAMWGRGMKSLDEARRVKSAIEQDLLKKPGVMGVDVGYRTIEGRQTSEPVIRVYVANKQEATRTLPSEVDGVLLEISERRFVLH